ncbi:autotransporter outer membrane beta-barrel domain-containing protein [Campylobacter sp. RM13744]|uniref:autotransporter outer membrane beta-barrel domain-containing protein n=1 Tax=Campylobacter molothri TaxID=1032242 RepID=UPI00301CE344|nr:autotransporter outer membrane beta-barrel domain-containing protein [Campylobacter sp. RM13744]
MAGGDLEKSNSSFSKKFLFSLVTVSVLSTYAEASITGPGCNGGDCATISDSKTGQIIITGNGSSNSLTISSGGTLSNGDNKAIYAHAKDSETLTITNLKNEGIINGKVSVENSKGNFTGTIAVNTFENEGQINGQIYMGIWGGKPGTLTIDNFNNRGTIKSNSQHGVFFQGKNTHIKTFENSGTIESSNRGVELQDGTIENFTNSGTIASNGNNEPEDHATNNTSTGIRIYNKSYIKTFDNQGSISGKFGVKLLGSTIDNFKNSGIIESTSKHKNGAAISISNLIGSGSTIKNFENSGTIKANDASGILIEAGNKIETLTNKGTIEASLYGIGFYAVDNYGDQVEIGKITIEENGVIKAGNDAIHIDGANKGIKGEGIDVKGRLEGGNAGIYIGGGKQVSTSIKVSGTIQGGNSGIINTGTIGQEDHKNQQYGITIENNGLITSTNGSGILNTENGIIYGNIINQSNNDLSLKNDSDATITSGIVNSGSGTIHINNQGSIGKNENGNNITNDGSGNIVVEDWVVSTGDDGKLEGIVVGGDKTDNVIIDNVTIDQGGLDLGELEDISNIVSGVKPGQVGNIGINGSGEISLGFDPITGKLSTDFNLNASIAGATFRSLINTTSRRASFIDSVMGNSMQHFAFAKPNTSIAMQEKGNLYANASDYIKNDFNNGSYGYNKEHSLFILPYTSSQNVELSLNEESKGHTRGTIIGYSTLKDSGIYGVYVGYEDTKMSSTYFDINNRSYYTGLKYFNTLFTTSKGQEVYLKAQGKTAFIKNKLSKKIGKSEAEASPNSYAYGMSGDLGMNFNHGDNIFSPEAGLVYEGGYTEAFSMINTKGQATVMGGERTYANYLNLLSTRTSFTWFRDWLPNLKTSMTLGAKFNINPQVKAKARFGQVKVKDEFYLPRVQRYVTTSMIVPLNNVFYFSLNYNGMFDSKGDTHTGFAQFNYIW